MALGIFAKLEKRKTVVPELNDAASEVFKSKGSISRELGFNGVLQLIANDMRTHINDIDQRRSLVQMMLVQELDADVIIHVLMATKIKNRLETSIGPAKSDDDAIQFVQLCKLYDDTIDWLAAKEFMSKEEAEELKGAGG
jgi:hypothetical protein